ncbi:MAG TPA: S-layer protein domain-containing protein [Candidatus Methanoperedens sp.]
MKKILTLLAIIFIFTETVIAANVTNVEIHGIVFDEKSDTYNTTLQWDAQKFPGFWYALGGGKSSETLKIDQAASSLKADSRAIRQEKLLYNTSRTEQKYKVFSNGNKKVDNGLEYNNTAKTFIKTPSGGYYARLGWFGELYVAVNGKANKLAKLVKEQKSEEKQTLAIGKMWELGEGHILTAQEIDAKAAPRQVRLVLSRDGNKLDDKILTEGQVYAYAEKALVGESDVPVFVTYVESIFSGTAGDVVQLRYTWLISQNVLEIKAGDKFGVFEVKEANDDYVLLYNKDKAINLDQNTVIDLAGGIKFKVADSSTALRFYPIVEKVIQPSDIKAAITATPKAEVAATSTAVATPTSALALASGPEVTNIPVKTRADTAEPRQWYWAIFAIAGLIITGYLVLRKN